MFDLVIRGDLVLPAHVLADGFVAARDGAIVAAALIYLALLWPLVRILSRLEPRTRARH